MRLGALLLTLILAGAGAESPVADAAQRGELEVVRDLLREGADVNAAQGDGMSALHWAAISGRPDIIDVLLYAGANTESTTRLGGYTPLHLASRDGEAESIEKLLQGGADHSALTTTGVTSLHFAAASGEAGAVEALVRHGAAIDARTSDDQTSLMWATAYNRVETMRVLLDAGADPSLTSGVVDYVALAAADAPERQLRERVMDVRRGGTGEVRGRGRGGPPAAQRGTQQGRGQRPGAAPEEEEAEEGASEEEGEPADEAESEEAQAEEEDESSEEEEDQQDQEEEERPLSYDDMVGVEGGFAALHFASRDGFIEAAELLLERGAELDQPTAGDGTTPLLMATINGHFDLAMRLIERGADPNATAEDGAAPLFTALNRRWGPKAAYPQPQAFKQQETDYLQLVSALIDAGADVNHQTGRHIWYTSFNFDMLNVSFAGATAFWRAAYATDVEAMKLLVAAGADPGIPTRKTPTRRFVFDPDSSDVDESGLPPIPIGGPGVYPIHAASGVGYGEGFAANSHSHAPDSWLAAVRYLVEEHGADVNARDLNGYAALHHAAARGDNELIEYLVSKGADVMVVSRRGETTVDMANGPRQRVQPFPETIALLEGLGAINNHNCQSCE